MHDCWTTRLVVAHGVAFGAMFMGHALADVAGAFIGYACGLALGIAIQVSEAKRKVGKPPTEQSAKRQE